MRPPHRWQPGMDPGTLEPAVRPDGLEKQRRRRAAAQAETLPLVIRDGAWHTTMVSAAGTLRRRGFSEQAATAALIRTVRIFMVLLL